MPSFASISAASNARCLSCARRRRLDRLGPGERVIVECTDPLSMIDIPHLVHVRGDVLEEKIERDGLYVFHIRAKMREPRLIDASALCYRATPFSTSFSAAARSFASLMLRNGSKGVTGHSA